MYDTAQSSNNALAPQSVPFEAIQRINMKLETLTSLLEPVRNYSLGKVVQSDVPNGTKLEVCLYQIEDKIQSLLDTVRI